MHTEKTPTSLFTRLAARYQHIWQHLQTAARHTAQHITLRRVLVLGTGMVGALAIGLIGSFCWPRSLTFSYSQSNCFVNPIILPRLVAQKSSATYIATMTPKIRVAGYPLYSHRTCITPMQTPNPKKSEIISLGTMLTQRVRVTPQPLPVIQNLTAFDTPLPTMRPLLLTLDQNDRIFSYRLAGNERTAPCTTHGRQLSCAVDQLKLTQSARYTVILQRVFHNTPSTIAQRPITTVEAMRVTGSSLTTGQTVYNVPTDITLTLNKPIVSLSGVHLYQGPSDNRQEVPVTITRQEATLTVHLTHPLARSASFTLALEQAGAADGGYLTEPFSLAFQTSGGPKVLGINIGSSRVQPASSVVITFDTTVSTSQAVADFIRLEVGGSAIAATVTTGGNRVTITPRSALPRCASFTVKVLDGLQNEFGIAGGSTWQFRSKVLCQTVFSIGASVQGRAITAYSFGTGPSKVIFVGATHGDEKSSAYILNSWIDYLETNADHIPAGRTIIVIPVLNPDGYVASRRTNAHNVDLNRNFPANDWKSGVTMPDQSYNPNGGGSAPLSEPESSALAAYVLSQNPRLVLTYHAVAGIVVPNGAGDSTALAQTYDQKSSVYFTTDDETDAVFAYDTTGSFEGWLYDKPGIPALLVELWTMSGNEFTKHQNALWAMATIP